MRRGWIGALIAVFFLVVATPGQAADMCDDYPDRMTAVETDWLHDRLNRIVPARYADLVRRIDIVAVKADADHLAPAVVPAPDGKRYRMEIPDGFAPFQCRMAVLQLYYVAQVLPDGSMPRQVMNLCIDRMADDDKWSCLFKAPRWILTGSKEALDIDYEKKRMFDLTQSAILGYLLHEFSHVVDREERRSREGEEQRADAFANMSMILSSADQVAMLSVFTALDMLDGRLGPGDHGTFLCRAKAASTDLLMLSDRIWVLTSWTNDDTRYLPDRIKQSRSPFHLPSGPLRAGAADTANCPDSGKSETPLLAADLDAMIAILDPLVGSADPLAFYQPLQGLKLKTRNARYVRGRMIANRLWKVYIRLGDDEAMRKRFLRIASSYAHHPDTAVMSAEDYGKVLGSVADSRFAVEFLPRNTVKRSALIGLRDDLRRAIFYSNRSLMSYITLLRIELLLGDCPAADALVALSAKYPGRESPAWQRVIENFQTEWKAELGCKGDPWVVN